MEPALTDLVSDEVAGKPTGGPRWIRRSLASLRTALAGQGFGLGRETIRRLLKKQKIRPKANRKRLTPKDHPDRDTQFQYLQQQRGVFEAAGWPTISVDTKNKELIGPFKQAGTTWSAQTTDVYMHDFPSEALARAVPYGIYDTARNEGYVHLGQSADTPEFAVDAIVAWWRELGQSHYQDVPELLVLADCGGSNGYRSRNWKRQLQVELVDAFGLSVTVCHYPSGASKWNPIEHRLFSEITKTWAGTPLRSFEVMLACLEQTTTETGLTVAAHLVERAYATGIRVSDAEMEALAVEWHATCPQWNYAIRPRQNGK
ncbi:MAG TPA: ISAzo13 family transposase [Gammaproteobacteria bacterium]|nr:ISAzo13 family transposase [Gammaproteobacteria bacterium]